MANDRVIIRCKSCGGWKMLLKHFPGIGPTTRDNDVLDWMDEHAPCHPGLFDTDLGGNPGFELVTENATALDMGKQNKLPRYEEAPNAN